MKQRLWSEDGQAFAELAISAFLFVWILLGLYQLTLLGMAQFQCQQTARRAAWLYASCQHAEFAVFRTQLAELYGGTLPPEAIQAHGSRENGMVVIITKSVPAIGFFQGFKPGGFHISSQSAVLAYLPKPKTDQILNGDLSAIWESLSTLDPR